MVMDDNETNIENPKEPISDTPKSPWKMESPDSPAVAGVVDSDTWPALSRTSSDMVPAPTNSPKPPISVSDASPSPIQVPTLPQKSRGHGNNNPSYKPSPRQQKTGSKRNSNVAPPFNVPVGTLPYHQPPVRPLYNNMVPWPLIPVSGYVYQPSPGSFANLETHIGKSGAERPLQAFVPPASGTAQPLVRGDPNNFASKFSNRRPEVQEAGGHFNHMWHNQRPFPLKDNVNMSPNMGPRPFMRPPFFGPPSGFISGPPFPGPPGSMYFFPVLPPLPISLPQPPYLSPRPSSPRTSMLPSDPSVLKAKITKQIEYYFRYKLIVTSPEPKKLASPTITNIQGWLPGLKTDGDTKQLPTIAIVASYDTFGAAPALSVGSDSNGSGVAALLEIARLFSILYSNPKTRGRYNILFGLTSGGPYNYNGTQKWLRSFDQRLRESIDYAICLNSVGSENNNLWLHVSKPPENAYIKQIFEGFTNVAEELGLNVGLKHKKINISDPRVAWEHEQFSRLRVTAATISGLPVAPKLLEHAGGLFDNRHFVHEPAVVRSVKLVAESIARHIYGQQGKNIEVFADNSSLAINPTYVQSWMDLLSRTPRVAPFLSKNDAFIMALKKELGDHVVEVKVQHDVIDGMFTFYDSMTNTLQIYQVASVTFDLLLLLVLGSYLITLFSFLVITTRGVDDLISLFRRPPSRKVKTA